MEFWELGWSCGYFQQLDQKLKCFNVNYFEGVACLHGVSKMSSNWVVYYKGDEDNIT